MERAHLGTSTKWGNISRFKRKCWNQVSAKSWTMTEWNHDYNHPHWGSLGVYVADFLHWATITRKKWNKPTSRALIESSHGRIHRGNSDLRLEPMIWGEGLWGGTPNQPGWKRGSSAPRRTMGRLYVYLHLASLGGTVNACKCSIVFAIRPHIELEKQRQTPQFPKVSYTLLRVAWISTRRVRDRSPLKTVNGKRCGRIELDYSGYRWSEFLLLRRR